MNIYGKVDCILIGFLCPNLFVSGDTIKREIVGGVIVFGARVVLTRYHMMKMHVWKIYQQYLMLYINKMATQMIELQFGQVNHIMEAYKNAQERIEIESL